MKPYCLVLIMSIFSWTSVVGEVKNGYATDIQVAEESMIHRWRSWRILCEQWARRELTVIPLPVLIRSNEIGRMTLSLYELKRPLSSSFLLLIFSDFLSLCILQF